VCGSGEL